MIDRIRAARRLSSIAVIPWSFRACAWTREPYARALITLEQAMLEHATGAPLTKELATDAFSALRALGAAPLAERAAALMDPASQTAEVAAGPARGRQGGHRRRGPG